MTPGQSPLIIVDGPTAHDIAALIRFIYHGEVSVDQGHLPDLLKTAAALKIKGLAEFPIDCTPPTSLETVANTRLQDASHQTPYDLQYHSEKFKVTQPNDYSVSPQTVNTLPVSELPQDQIIIEQESDNLPLNLSCKRNRYGDPLPVSMTPGQSDEFQYNDSSLSRDDCVQTRRNVYSDPSPCVTKILNEPFHSNPEYSRDVSDSSDKFYSFVTPPKTEFPLSDSKSYYVASEPIAKIASHGISSTSYVEQITPSPTLHYTSTAWKISKDIVRDPQQVILASNSNVYHVPANNSVVTPVSVAPATEYRGPVIKSTSTPALVLPQPPMKRIRTVEPLTQQTVLTQSVCSRQPSVPALHAVTPVTSASCMTILSPVQPSNLYSIENTSSLTRTPVNKKYHEIINVCQPQGSNLCPSTDMRTKTVEEHSKSQTISPTLQYKYIPIKTENISTDDDCQKIKISLNSPDHNVFSKTEYIKHEMMPLKTSPPLEPSVTLSDNIIVTSNSILSSVFISPTSSIAATGRSVTVHNTTPVKTSTFSSAISSSLSPQQTGSHIHLQQKVSPVSVACTASPLITDTKSIHKPVVCNVPTHAVGSDDAQSQSITTSKGPVDFDVGHHTATTYASTCNIISTTSSGSGCVTTSVTTTTSTLTGPLSGGATAASDANSGSSQRVSINMRTFKVNNC